MAHDGNSSNTFFILFQINYLNANPFCCVCLVAAMADAAVGRRHVTVMFCDLVDSPASPQRSTPKSGAIVPRTWTQFDPAKSRPGRRIRRRSMS